MNEQQVARWEIAAVAAGVAEATWLAAVVLLPLSINPHIANSFGLFKAAVLEALVATGLVAWGLRSLAQPGGAGEDAHRADDARADRPLRHIPVVLAAAAVALSWTVSTALSINPLSSFFGTALRGGGAWTAAGHLVLFLLVASHLRTAAQWRRLRSALLLAGTLCSVYALAQFAGFDALATDPAAGGRSFSSIGNPTTLAAYLLVPGFIAGERVVAAWRSARVNGVSGRLAVAVSVLAIHALAILSTRSRAAVLAAVVSVLIVWLAASATGGHRGWRVPLGALALLVLLVGASFLRGPLTGTPLALGRSPGELEASGRQRILIWDGLASAFWSGSDVPGDPDTGLPMDRWRFLVGWGPESVDDVFVRYRTPFAERQLGGAPDRAHNAIFDALVTRGSLGLSVSLIFAVATILLLLRALGLVADQRAADTLLGCVAVGGATVSGVGYLVGRAYLPAGGPAFLLSGVALPAGMLAGLVAYVAWVARCRSRGTGANSDATADRASASVRRPLAMLGALVAAFVVLQLSIDSVAMSSVLAVLLGAVVALTRAGTDPMSVATGQHDRAAVVGLGALAAASVLFAITAGPGGAAARFSMPVGAQALTAGYLATVAVMTAAFGYQLSRQPQPGAGRHSERLASGVVGVVVVSLLIGVLGLAPHHRRVVADLLETRAGQAFAAGDLDGALRTQQEALAVWRLDAGHWSRAGSILTSRAMSVGQQGALRARMLDEAVELLQRSAELDPYNPQRFMDLAQVWQLLASETPNDLEAGLHVDRAIAALEWAQALAPFSRQVSDSLAALRLRLP